MKYIEIKEIASCHISGIKVQLPASVEPYKETYFQWEESTLTGSFQTSTISGGILKTWHSKPIFREIENHVDEEIFYFISGVAIMVFADVINGCIDMDSIQMVRIQPGTQVIIEKGKGHFVPVADGDIPLTVVVVAPKMDAPRYKLEEAVEGIEARNGGTHNE